jgi:hypothetical protein
MLKSGVIFATPSPRCLLQPWIAVPGDIYDSQVTHWKQGRLPVRAPLPRRTSIGRVGVIHDSQLAGIHKKPQQTGGCSYFLIEKSSTTAFFGEKKP